ncbi:MAG: molybdopterin-guanine dinucleotide biosynthesis protein MobB, partial [Cereibacter changlensis]
YPSLLAPQVAASGDEIKDRAQVRLLARALYRLGRAGELGQLFDAAPDWPGRSEEGWILGVGQADLLRRALA